MVKVTVGICVKNVEQTVRKTLMSILRQDFPHKLMEIIVVDGHSQDRTLLIIRDVLSKSDMNYEILFENKGLGFARNLVVNNACGKYIIWVDGDMILPEDYIKKQVEFMEKNPNIGVAIGTHGVLPSSNLIATLEDVAYIAVDLNFRNSSSRLPGTGGAVFRVNAVRQVGGFDSSLRGVGEDIELTYRVKKAGWLVQRGTHATFYEKRKGTLKELWNHYLWYGYGAYDVFRKNRRIVNFPFMNPIAGFFLGAWYSVNAYKSILQKKVFLLPLHYLFKRMAWFCGFFKAQIDHVRCKS